MLFQTLLTRIKTYGQVNRWFGGLRKEFWLGNMFIILSTVLGVYLAAHSGLKTAMEFDQISSDKDNYYLRANLRDEVLYNIGITERIIKTIDKIGTFDRSNYPNFQTYILDTMKQQPNTLKTPNNILNGVLRYYDDVNSLFDKRRRVLISYPELANKLRDRVASFKKETLVKMEDDLAALRTRLQLADVELY